MPLSGSIKFFNVDRGFGFIKRDDGKGDVFVHIKDLRKTGIETVDEGDELSFEIEKTEKGWRAVNVKAA